MAKKTVTVTYDGSTLVLEPKQVDLVFGDCVEWVFQGAPSDCIAGVRFESLLGPFQCLHAFPPSTMVGLGNLGEAVESSYPYMALLLSEEGVLAQTAKGAGTVRNLAQLANSSPEAVVRCVPEKRGNEVHYRLDVQPERLRLSPGDTATWHVFGLPEEYFTTLRFLGAHSPSCGRRVENRMVGPFQSLMIRRRVDGERSNVVRISGLDFAHPQEKYERQYRYRIEVRDAFGTVRGSHDPVIDNLGDPGPPAQGCGHG